MKIVPCRCCKGLILSSNVSCPHCGHAPKPINSLAWVCGATWLLAGITIAYAWVA